jgi:hypothetical protein
MNVTYVYHRIMLHGRRRGYTFQEHSTARSAGATSRFLQLVTRRDADSYHIAAKNPERETGAPGGTLHNTASLLDDPNDGE